MKQKSISGYSLLFILSALLLSSCGEKTASNKNPIVIGDPNSIVMEKDSQYLENYVDDISPSSKKSNESQITKMMVQVDSLQASKKLENDVVNNKKIEGFTINFAECSVIFDGIYAHALKPTQNEREENSVSYVKDAGEFTDTKLQISGLTDLKVEQRLFVKLAVEQNDETFIMDDLGRYITQWYPLAGKENLFVSASQNSLQFDNVDHTKIRNGLERELRKRKKNKSEIDAWIKLIEQTQTYSDAPCKLIPVSSQWKISGKKDGRNIRKLIQFDKL
jgi:hypothetical protein